MKWTKNKVRGDILRDQSRFKVIVAGRRWGKTHLALMWLCSGHIQAGDQRWFIAPTYRQGKMIAFPVLRQIFRTRAKINESELKVTLPNTAEICIKGADNEDSLRGAGLGTEGGNAVVLDEYAYMKPHVWEEIVLPMLATSEGKAMFIGTPNGYDEMYNLWLRGQSDPDWKSWQFKTIDGGFVSEAEIERLKHNMDGRRYRQEMEGSFESTGNKAAYNFDRNTHLRKDAEKPTIVYSGLDYNVDYMTAVKVYEYTDQTIHYADEIRLSNSNTDEMAKEIKERWKDVRIIYPDPAGSARSTTSHRSDHQILRDYGFHIIAKRAHPPVKDRLNALNRKLKDANGKISMTVDPSCKYLIKDLEQCQRDKKGGLDKSNINLTHALDACSYLIDYKWSVIKRIGTSVQW